MDDIIHLIFINTMGESILVETLRSAAYFVMRSGNFCSHRPETVKFFKKSRHCYFFMQSTALDVLIRTYDLCYDPEELRQDFHYLVTHSMNCLARNSN